MTNKIDQNDLDIINFRPRILFTEPKVESILPAETPAPPDFVDMKDKWNQLGKLATAAGILAEAFQAKVDKKVENFTIGLNKNSDAAVIDAMRRRFPNADPNEITFEQYRECRERMRDRGDAIGREMAPDLGKVKELRMDPGQKLPDGLISFDDPDALRGLSTRPDLQSDKMPIEPINMEEFQETLFKKLMNLLWKKFIKAAISPLIPPPLNSMIPDEIA
jgi:hypothetical protein